MESVKQRVVKIPVHLFTREAVITIAEDRHSHVELTFEKCQSKEEHESCTVTPSMIEEESLKRFEIYDSEIGEG